MQSISNFLILCSGCHPSILKKTPTDTNKYIGIGATILFTGLFAALAAGYAVYTVFDSWIASAGIALIWGLMIFNLDRYLVSSMKHSGSAWRDLFIASPRILMAIVISIVISKPLELKIFEKEINGELVVMEQELYKTQEDRVKSRFESQAVSYQQDIDRLKAEIQSKSQRRDELALIAQQEADGTGGSKQKNLGPIYQTKKKDADKAEQELKELIAVLQPQILDKEKKITEWRDKQTSEINTLQRAGLGGIASRIEAMSRLSNQSKAIWMAGLFILFLFIVIETAPLFVKLISGRSPYEYVLHKHEFAIENNHKEITSIAATIVNNRIEREKEVNTYATQAIIKSERKLMDEAIHKEVERLKQGSLDWKTWLAKGGFLKEA